MNNRKWVENTILGIIVLNIFVMAFVFLIPRMEFIANHWGWKAEAPYGIFWSYGYSQSVF